MTGFFWSRNESEKCFRQIAHIAYNCFFYSDARRYVNAIFVERLISKSSCHSGQYERITAKWLAFNNDMFRIPKIPHAWLITANIYYGLFVELNKSSFYLEYFEVPVINGLSSVKVVKTSASSSFANGSSGFSFRFVKYPPCLKATQVPTSGFVKRPSLLMEIKGPPQPLVDGIICPFPSVVDSACNGNSEQFQFDCIL